MKVNVEKTIVEQQLKKMQESYSRLKQQCTNLAHGLTEMQDWTDIKATKTIEVVRSCGQEFVKMLKEFEREIKGLETLLKQINEYESVNLTSGGSSGYSGRTSVNTGNVQVLGNTARIHCYDDLDDEEERAFYDYTGNQYYRNINGSLWNPDNIKPTPDNARRIEVMKNAFANASLPISCRVYRGTDRRALGALAGLTPDEMVGHRFDCPAFMSTSASMSTARQFLNMNHNVAGPLIISFDAREGDHAIDISGRGQCPNESEILYNVGTSMIIESAHEEHGVLYVNARLIRRYVNRFIRV